MFLDPTCKRVFNAIVEARSQGAPTGNLYLRSRLEASGELEAVGGEFGLTSLLDTYPIPTSASADAGGIFLP